MTKDKWGRAGMTLIEVLCVVAIVVLLVGMLWPAPRRHGDRSRIKCVNNLKNVGLGFRIWATDNNDVFPFQVSTNDGGTLELLGDVAAQFRALSNDLVTPRVLLCPSDYPRRREGTNWAELRAREVSYFVEVTARETNEVSVLAGDRGLVLNGLAAPAGVVRVRKGDQLTYDREIHTMPNWLLADGSVRFLRKSEMTNLARVVEVAGLGTNVFVGVR